MERPYPHGQPATDLDALRNKLMGKHGFAARYTEIIDGVAVTMTVDDAIEAFGKSIASVPEHHILQTFDEMAERALALAEDDPAAFDRSLLMAGRDALAKLIADRQTG